MENLKNHNIVEGYTYTDIIFEKRPCLNFDGTPVKGLFNAWIMLNNPKQYNSYTTKAVKEIILAFGEASNDRSVVAVVFTGVEDKAFCTGGNTKEYAEYYSGNPQEYSQYMRLFNDMVSAILKCEKPVVCRVNGMRVGGGQEIGMAADFTVASDLARFSQAGPKHGSAAIGGATDFLHLYVGVERAMMSLTLCEPWTAHQALNLGMITDVAPALKVDGKFIVNPLVNIEKYADEYGRIIFGAMKTGEELAKGKELMANGESIDIYPNPASTSFEITTNNKQIIQEVKLYSIEGKLLKQQTFLENKAKINTSQLPQGMYIIEVKTKKEQVYKKLLILH